MGGAAGRLGRGGRGWGRGEVLVWDLCSCTLLVQRGQLGSSQGFLRALSAT